MGIYAKPDLDMTWQEFSNCLGVDPDLFFPERGASTREAKEVCRGCVVQADCLEYALQNGEKFGIWGGMSERERRRIRRQRALARVAAAEAAEAAGEAQSRAVGSVVASDAFFPFADGLLAAAEAGATAIIQPGGSMRDDQVIAAADENGLAMVFTGMRHFRH